MMPKQTEAFAIRRVGTTGRDPDGRIIAWAVTEPWAALIAFLLNRAEEEGSVGSIAHACALFLTGRTHGYSGNTSTTAPVTTRSRTPTWKKTVGWDTTDAHEAGARLAARS